MSLSLVKFARFRNFKAPCYTYAKLAWYIVTFYSFWAMLQEYTSKVRHVCLWVITVANKFVENNGTSLFVTVTGQ